MKLSEKWIDSGDGKLVQIKTFANDPYIEKAKQLRDAGAGVKGESRCAGIVPMHIINEWLKEAGVKWDDVHARQEVVRRKMLSGEFDKLRVWEGTF